MGLAQIDPKSHTNFAGFQAAGMVLKNQTAPRFKLPETVFRKIFQAARSGFRQPEK